MVSVPNAVKHGRVCKHFGGWTRLDDTVHLLTFNSVASRWKAAEPQEKGHDIVHSWQSMRLLTFKACINQLLMGKSIGSQNDMPLYYLCISMINSLEELAACRDTAVDLRGSAQLIDTASCSEHDQVHVPLCSLLIRLDFMTEWLEMQSWAETARNSKWKEEPTPLYSSPVFVTVWWVLQLWSSDECVRFRAASHWFLPLYNCD